MTTAAHLDAQPEVTQRGVKLNMNATVLISAEVISALCLFYVVSWDEQMVVMVALLQ